MKRLLLVITLIAVFFLGSCSSSTVHAEQIWPLKIWKQNENGSVSTYHLVDSDTGVNYVVVTAQNYSNAMTIAITPRLNADGSLYVN